MTAESGVLPSHVFRCPALSFLLAAQTRWRRGNTRKQALVHMRELLTAAVRVGGVTHLVGPVTAGPSREDPRSVVSVSLSCPVWNGQKAFQRFLLGPNVRSWCLLVFSPKIIYFSKNGTGYNLKIQHM